MLILAQYCKKHVDAASKPASDDTRDKAVDEDLKAWDADFVKVDQATLFDVILVSNPPSSSVCCIHATFYFDFSRSVAVGAVHVLFCVAVD